MANGMVNMTKLDLGPSDYFAQHVENAPVLLLACGALAREVVDLIAVNQWRGFDIQCLPAKWHNTPQFIVPALREKIRANKANYKTIFVLYGDCGTGGQLDTMLAEEGVDRIQGPHCYAFFIGNQTFDRIGADDFTSFYLTDYLARHFDKLMWQGLGLDRHPELRDDYFRHYTKVIYLAQTKDKDLEAKAEAAAKQLGLEYEYRFTGYGELRADLEQRNGE
jgi:Protein of unknown function (DUF1638)